jgi:CDP-diglyceride synthetase
MEISLSKIPNIERYKIVVWFPVIYGFYFFNLLPGLVFILVLLGLYEIASRPPISSWTIIASFHMISFWSILSFPIQEIWLLLIVVFVNDAMAFFGGKYLNIFPWMKKNIFHPISPKKTFGGFLYGLFAGSIAGIIVIDFFELQLNVPSLLLVSSLCCAGVLGDLLNSKFQRHYKIKDSGQNLLTGKLMFDHSGIYDRFDAISLACLYWLGFKFLF